MKKTLLALLLSSVCGLASAEVGFFAGVTYAFGDKGGVGFTVKALSSRDENKAVAAVGTTVYPFGERVRYGIDVGAGYQGVNVGGIASYDVLNNLFGVSGGYSNTKASDPAPVVVVPAPVPAPG